MTDACLHALLDDWAAERPDEVPYRFYAADAVTDGPTWSELRTRALRLAGRLERGGASGRLVALACTTPDEYITGFFGCLYAGAIAVSAAAPTSPRMTKAVERLARTIGDTSAEFALAQRAVTERVTSHPDLAGLGVSWLDLEDAPDDQPATAGTVPRAGGQLEDLAYVQYTSGSTGGAKGVELTHANFLANLDAQAQAYAMGADSVIVSWMPLFHDFGFVAPVLQPLRLGCRTVFIATQRFILRPATWVQAVSRCRGTVSGGPTFAYDLVVDRITFDELAELDLSTWQHAIIGSEPINAATIERFRAAFEPVGLSPTAVTGGFGLAEETCLLTADRGPARPTVRRFCRHGLARGLASPSDGADSVPLVGCGQVVAGHELAIVDAESRQRLPDGRIGEIWAAGPSVAQRYRDAPEASASAFVAPPPGMFSAPATTALRTGDLGFWLDDQLYVTGRTKDVIIIRGENHLPHHLESVATQSDPRLAGLRAAAFSVPTSEGEGLVVLQECAQWDQPAAAQIIAGIQAAVVASHGIRAHDIRLLAPGQIPRTPSGKVKRGMCRQRYLSAERFC